MTKLRTTLITTSILVLGLLVTDAVRADEEEVRLQLSECPAAVQKTLKREAGGSKIGDVVRFSQDADLVYIAELTLDENKYQVLVAKDGMLLHKLVADGEDHSERETELDVEDCPEAVQKTLEREAPGYPIELVIERTANGDTVYLADVELDHVDYAIVVAPDGTLISKSLYEDEEVSWDEASSIVI
jgi:hypothetical protein